MTHRRISLAPAFPLKEIFYMVKEEDNILSQLSRTGLNLRYLFERLVFNNGDNDQQHLPWELLGTTYPPGELDYAG